MGTREERKGYPIISRLMVATANRWPLYSITRGFRGFLFCMLVLNAPLIEFGNRFRIGIGFLVAKVLCGSSKGLGGIWGPTFCIYLKPNMRVNSRHTVTHCLSSLLSTTQVIQTRSASFPKFSFTNNLSIV